MAERTWILDPLLDPLQVIHVRPLLQTVAVTAMAAAAAWRYGFVRACVCSCYGMPEKERRRWRRELWAAERRRQAT